MKNFTAEEQYIYNQSGIASFNAPWIDCSRFSSLVLNVWWTAVELTDGTLSVEGSNDYRTGQTQSPASASIVTLVLTTPADGETGGFMGNSGSFTVSTTASGFIAILKPPPRLVRFAYTRTAGGGANQFFGSTIGRFGA